MTSPPNAAGQPGAATTNPVFGALWPMLLVTSALLAAGAVASQTSLLGWLAAITFTSAGVVFAMSGTGRNASRRVTLEGDRVTVSMRRTFPTAAAAFSATMAAFLATYAANEDETVIRAAAAAAAVMALVVLPDLLRAALTHAHLTFDSRGITVRSWSTDASIDWADVALVDVDISIPTRPALRIITRPGSRTLSARRRRFLVPLEPRAPQGQIIINTLPLDEPWLLTGRLATLVDLSTEDRSRRITGNTLNVLTGRIPFHG